VAVTIDDVRHIASLARLGIGDDRAAALVAELNAILGRMDVLASVDTSGVPAMTGVEPREPSREDAGPAIAMAHPIERLAPLTRDGFFLVPRLSTHDAKGAES
jgi:aspartyl-tRNA(Asn)/glutamyl-tRNA(Gln) amidotransferase subunit C